MLLKGIFYTLLISMIPMGELRLSVPLGYAFFKLPIWVSVATSVVGNTLAIAVLLKYLPDIVKFFSQKSRYIKNVLENVFDKTRKEHSHKFLVWGEVLLLLFVTVPIPGSGGWTAAIIVFLFGFPYRLSMKYITFGIILSGVLMGFLTLGFSKILSIFFS